MGTLGWLLDASIDWKRKALTLWIKVNGKTRGYTYYDFLPSIYVSTDLIGSLDWSDESVLRAVRAHSDVVSTEIVQRYVSVYDEVMKPVLQVFTNPTMMREVAKDLEQLPGATVFHADMDPVQQFFIINDIFPFGRVEFEQEDGVVTSIKCLDSHEDSEYEVPELEQVRIEVFIDTPNIFPQIEDPIHHIEVIHKGGVVNIEMDDEREMLLALQRTIDRLDPDVIETKGGDEQLFRYLTLRSKVNGVSLVFSRDGTHLNVTYKEANSFWQYNQIVYKAGNQVMFDGRIHIDRTDSMFAAPTRLEGVVEGSRLSFARPQRVSRMSIGSINAAIQYYNAFKMGILIPPIKRNPEFLKSVNDLATIDRGGLIFQPKPDIYENVVEVDFSSMYPTLMVTRNISPETICTKTQCPHDKKDCNDVPGLSFKLCTRRRGIVSKSLELIVKKRKEFKRLIQRGRNAKKYALMQNTLKGVLVSCFGYLGFKNARFGRVEAHTAVCALARDVLLRTQEIGEEMGLDMIHGIVDSLWFRSSTEIGYETAQEFCRRVTDDVDIDMSLKGVFRWMVIPSSRLHPSIAPLNRYYGVYRNGGIKTRGIETRRRDTCLYVGDCQKAMIETLAQGRDKEGFLEMIPSAYAVCEDYITRLREGDVDLRDLVLHSRLSREPDEYRATSRAAVVAQQLVKSGRELHAGQKVNYVMVDADSPNPLRRVKALELFNDSTRYDPEAYAKLCSRAFESLIPNQYISESIRSGSESHMTQSLIQ
ncbi:MAG: DNA polymerase domain-containing protein [Candidatus Thorarchaeota archaeon]|jgi:DNA polymerase elongation subunit (family B)